MTEDLRVVFSRVKARLVRRGFSESDSEDCVQEAWLRMMRSKEPVENTEAFLMTVSLNLATDLRRARAIRGKEISLEDVAIEDPAPSVEEEASNRERVARLLASVGRLDQRTREVLLAHRIEGLKYQQIAERFDIALSTVHKLIAKALLLITADLEGW